MTKRKPQSEAESPDLLPTELARQRTDELLRAMLTTPPDPHVTPKARKKPAKRAKK